MKLALIALVTLLLAACQGLPPSTMPEKISAVSYELDYWSGIMHDLAGKYSVADPELSMRLESTSKRMAEAKAVLSAGGSEGDPMQAVESMLLELSNVTWSSDDRVQADVSAAIVLASAAVHRAIGYPPNAGQ